MSTGDGEVWIKGLELEPADDRVDAASWMAAEVRSKIDVRSKGIQPDFY